MSAGVAQAGDGTETLAAAHPPPASRHRIVHLENLGDELRIYWQDGHCTAFLALWLRDNGPRIAAPVAPAGDDPGLLPDTLTIDEASVDAAAGDVRLRFEPEGLSLRFPTPWLRRHGDAAGAMPCDEREPWNADLSARLPRAWYRDVRASDERLRCWLEGIRIHGVGLLRGLPPTPGMMLRLVERFAHPRRVAAGACFAPDETAFADFTGSDRCGRSLHTAAPFRDPAPGLRIVHCLSPAEHGGETVLVDGLRAARIVAHHHPVYFRLLTRLPVPFSGSDGGHRFLARRPMIDAGDDCSVRGLCYDPVQCLPVDLPHEVMRDFYSAYCCLARTLNRTDLRLRIALRSGDVLVLDNRRVLYGHAPYQGERIMEHGYAEWGDLDARWRALSDQREGTAGGAPDAACVGIPSRDRHFAA